MLTHNVTTLYSREKGDPPSVVHSVKMKKPGCKTGTRLVVGQKAVLLSQGDTGIITLYETAFPFQTEEPSGFLKNPMFLGCIGVTVVWQIMRYMKSKGGSGKGDDDSDGSKNKWGRASKKDRFSSTDQHMPDYGRGGKGGSRGSYGGGGGLRNGDGAFGSRGGARFSEAGDMGYDD